MFFHTKIGAIVARFAYFWMKLLLRVISICPKQIVRTQTSSRISATLRAAFMGASPRDRQIDALCLRIARRRSDFERDCPVRAPVTRLRHAIAGRCSAAHVFRSFTTGDGTARDSTRC